MQFDNKAMWSSELLKAQEHYFSAVNQYFTALQGQSYDQHTWKPFFDQLNQTAAAAFSAEDFPVFSHLLQQSAKINSFYNNFADCFSRIDAAKTANTDWRSQVEDVFREIQQQWQQVDPAASHFADIAHSIEHVQNYWQEFVAVTQTDNFDKQFGQCLTAWLKHHSVAKQVTEELNALLDLWRDYMQALSVYEQTLSQVNVIALDKSKQKLIELCESGTEINSLRAIYNLWIDAQEEAYQEIVFTEQHSQVFAGVVNSFMRLRKMLNTLAERSAVLLHRADKNDLEAVVKKQSALASELEQSKEELHANKRRIDELTTELNELKTFMQAQHNQDEGGEL